MTSLSGTFEAWLSLGSERKNFASNETEHLHKDKHQSNQEKNTLSCIIAICIFSGNYQFVFVTVFVCLTERKKVWSFSTCKLARMRFEAGANVILQVGPYLHGKRMILEGLFGSHAKMRHQHDPSARIILSLRKDDSKARF